jgi:RNA polymerase subunit RPABC4/transcription elongation factor Spt4
MNNWSMFMILSNEQKILYLANAVATVRADGTFLHRSESHRSDTKINRSKKTELRKAYQKAEQKEFQPSPVGFWSDKIKNLENIIYVSMIDGSIDNSEKQLILAFAKQVEISQAQLSLILNDVKRSVSHSSDNISCQKCKATITGASKFCPECGAAIQASSEPEAIAVSYEIPASGIAIEFPESTATGFAFAVRDHKNAPVNATCVKGKKTWYLSAWPIESISQSFQLIENLKGIRNRKVYVDGKRCSGVKCSDLHHVLKQGRLLIGQASTALALTKIA